MRRTSFFVAIAGAAMLVEMLAFGAAAQTEQPPPPPGMSQFLVARPEMPDPLFAESVILMLPRTGGDLPLVAGLIVNKPLRTITLHKLFPDSSALKQRTDLAFFGGPVDIETPAILFRADQKIDKATHLAGDVYVSLDADQAAVLAQDPRKLRDFRLILGRAQWTPDQLHSEIMEGSWYTVNADASIVFAADAASLWSTMSAHARLIPAAAASIPRLSPQLWAARYAPLSDSDGALTLVEAAGLRSRTRGSDRRRP